MSTASRGFASAHPAVWALLLAIAIVCFSIALVTPPFQAPDEPAHVQRAFMLSNGQLLLHSVDGSPSGGMVDKGLLQYMSEFEPITRHAQRTENAGDLQRATALQWREQDAFVHPTGTAYYFPALYLPQAVGLRVGMTSKMSVNQSYMLARFLTLGTCLLLLFLAFRIYAPPLTVLAVLALPMNLFLFSSAVLDPVATTASVLVLACFVRSIIDGPDTPPAVLLLLVVATVLVTSCRANLLPFLALPFAVSWRTRDRRLFVYSLLGALFVLGWTMYTVKYTVYPNDLRNIDHAKRLLSYLFHPWKFISILFATLTDKARVDFYAQSFIGVLGALDTALSPKAYKALAVLLVLVFLLALPSKRSINARRYRAVLLACGLAAVLLTFLALLVQWTIEPATTIDGIQGRYFTIPVLVLAYALPAWPSVARPRLERIQSLLTALLLTIGAYYSIQALVQRYYIGVPPEDASRASLETSRPLMADQPLALHFPPEQVESPDPLRRIDVRFGTYMTMHTGTASLHLWTNRGESTDIPFALSSVEDNAYKRFDLDGKRYIGGEIISRGGHGISTYERRQGSTPKEDCMVIYPVSSQLGMTTRQPCPLP